MSKPQNPMTPSLADLFLRHQWAVAVLDGVLKLIQSAYPVSVQRPAPDRLRLEFRRS